MIAMKFSGGDRASEIDPFRFPGKFCRAYTLGGEEDGLRDSRQ